MLLPGLRFVAPCLAALVGCGCAMPQERAGELVGAYRINGELLENTCGSAALPAADPLRFQVEVRRQGGSGLWFVSAPPPHLGSLADDGDFSFERQSTYDLGARQPIELLVETDIERLADPEAAQQLGDDAARPCRLAVSERVAGTLLRDSVADDGQAEAADEAESGTRSGVDLVGENEIAVRVASGDCRPSLEANGGPFERLPCEVRYELEGELIDP
jgi:hypothetical protein